MSTKNKNVLVDFRISGEAARELSRLGYNVCRTLPHPLLYDAVIGHPDMTLFKGGGKFVCEPRFYEQYRALIPPEIELICGKSVLGGKYPADICYNAADIGGRLVHNVRYTDEEILKLYSPEQIINVRQGYAKCSICTAADAVITSDAGIYNALKASTDILKIRTGFIRLGESQDGFIGGASGFIDGVVIFNGSLAKHPDGDNIRAFLANRHIDAVSLTDDELTDIGTIIPLF